jgi:hypothetical protein
MPPGQDGSTLPNLPISEQSALQGASQEPKPPSGDVSCAICSAETEGGNALCEQCKRLIADRAGEHD